MRIPFDKKLHALASVSIGLITLLIMKDYGFSQNLSVSTAAVAVVVTAAGKEAYDKFSGNGTPERADFTVSGFSGILSIIGYEVIKHFIDCLN